MNTLFNTIADAFKSIWSKSQKNALPQRVVRSIQRNDDMSEVLVKLIQLFVFALWGLIYLAAPEPNPETVSRFPLVIGIYLVFTLFALVLAARRALPDSIIYLSILIDVALLTYLIWSFHIQYEQPASFSLKAPAILNYFVLIGLRALRFDARYVVAAGVASVTGWSMLVLYVVLNDPVDPMVTRDYVTYLTSNSVLVGAEISKLISMIMFTAILAISVRRAHAFLATAIEEGNAAQQLSRFMASPVAEHIRDAEDEAKAGEGVRRKAAVLYVDIRGFTKLAATIEPDAAMAMLSDYQGEILPIVHRHGGSVDKFLGDGIMITFGAVEEAENSSANALRCVSDILEGQSNWKGPVASVRIGVAVMAGPVIFGTVGVGDRLEYTVIGSTVNIAAKLEKHNKVVGSRALCDLNTYTTAIAQGYVSDGSERRLTSTLAEESEPRELVVLA